MQYFDAAARARRPAHRGRPAAHRHRRPARRCTCSRCPAPTSRWPTGCCTSRSREGLVDEEYVAARTTGFDAVRAGRRRLLAGPGRAASPASPVGRPAATRSALLAAAPDGDDPDRPRRRAAQQRHRHRAGLHQPGARARPARQAVLAATARITGQGNGQGGREHGQKADQLPGYRSSTTRPPARTSPAVWGVDPDELPRPGRVGLRAARPRSAPTAACGRCWCWPPTSWSPPRTPAASRDRLAALDFLVVSDIFLSETAALADVVLPTAQWAEEDGTMTNLEGRVIRRRRALAAARRACATTWRCSRSSPTGSAAASTSPTDPRDGVRRAAPGQRRRDRRLRRHHLRADRRRATGVFWPCPRRDHPGTPRLFPDALRHPGRPGPVPRASSTGAPAETPDARLPATC